MSTHSTVPGEIHRCLRVASLATGLVSFLSYANRKSVYRNGKSLSEAASRLIARFVDEIWNRGNFAELDQLVASDYSVDGERVGRDWIVDNVASFHRSFPDLNVSIQSIVCEANQVAALLRIRGTQLSDWRGIQATGKQVDYREAAFWTIRDGQILSGEFVAESLTLRIQLGQISPSIWRNLQQESSCGNN